MLFVMAIVFLSACERNCECTKTTTIFSKPPTTESTNYPNDIAKDKQCSDLNSIDTTYCQHPTIEPGGDTIMITEPLHVINISCK